MADKEPGMLVEVMIKRDFWDADGVRHAAGTVVKVPVDAALEGVESGALGRVKKPDAD